MAKDSKTRPSPKPGDKGGNPNPVKGGQIPTFTNPPPPPPPKKK